MEEKGRYECSQLMKLRNSCGTEKFFKNRKIIFKKKK